MPQAFVLIAPNKDVSLMCSFPWFRKEHPLLSQVEGKVVWLICVNSVYWAVINT
jgi:hypothetical protein